MEGPQYIDVPIAETGDLLRITYDVTIGELLIASFLAGILLYLIQYAVIRILWRR